jgi:hypothetical protein
MLAVLLLISEREKRANNGALLHHSARPGFEDEDKDEGPDECSVLTDRLRLSVIAFKGGVR